MQVNVIPGKTYAVSSSSGCTVTCEHNGLSYTLCTASGGQAYFVPPVDTVTISDDTAIITETFNAAPMAASGGGGGGTGASITVDQTYSATSTNAQSGVAVSRALNTLNCKAEGTYVKIGTESLNDYGYATNVGHKSSAKGVGATSLGYNSHAERSCSIAVGTNCLANAENSVAIGFNAAINDVGTLLLSSNCWVGTVNYITNLYLIAASSALANKYEGGEACLGYVVKAAGSIVACGTRKLSELLTNNTAFAPAAFGLDDEPTPGPFLPTGILEPMEMDEIFNQ